MAISLRKGKKITPRVIENEYKLVIANQHGDADAETLSEYYFTKGQLKMLKDVLEIVESDRNQEELGLQITALQDKYADSDLESLFHVDAVYTGSLCEPSVKELTWFDAKGDQFKVTIKNGEE